MVRRNTYLVFMRIFFIDDVSFRMDIHNLGRVDADDCLLVSSCQVAWRAMAHASGGSGGGCCRFPRKGVTQRIKIIRRHL